MGGRDKPGHDVFDWRAIDDLFRLPSAVRHPSPARAALKRPLHRFSFASTSRLQRVL